MVARGAGAAGPVLLACRQWDPRGLARRLPSLRAGAWCGAPLLPPRVQCPVCVCAALAAGSGGSGRRLVSYPPRFPLRAPRVLRCVWRAVLSGCPLSSLVLVRHSMRSVRFAGSVRLPFWSSRVFLVCVCARAPVAPAPPPLPWLVWRVHFARSRCWALLGPFHSVRAPPAFLLRSRVVCVLLLSLSVPLWGGERPVPFPPYLAWGCVPPLVWACASGAFPRWGVGWWWGGAACVPFPRSMRSGGQWDWGSPRLGPSLCLPWGGNKAGDLHVALAMEGVDPILSRFVFSCCLWARSVGRPWRQGSFVHRDSYGSRRLGRGGGPCSGLPPGRRSPAGGRGITATASGRVGAGIPVACGSLRWLGGSGGIGPRLSLSLSGGGPLSSPALYFLVYALSPGCGAACRRGPAWQGGGGVRKLSLRGDAQGAGGAGGRVASVRPSDCSPWAGNIAGVTGDARPVGARPPYCSGSLWCAAPGCGPCAALARWSGFARLPRPPRGQPVGGVGARGVQVRLCLPSGRHGPFLGRGDALLAAGGVEGRRPCGPRAGGEWGGRGGGGAPLFPSPLPRGAARGPRPCPPPFSGHPPWVYTCRRAVLGAGRGPVGRRWVSAGGGWERFPRVGLLPRLPQAGIKVGRLVCVFGHHRAAAAYGAGAEPPGGSGLCGSARATNRGCLTRGCVRRGSSVSPLGAGPPSFWSAHVCPRAGRGGGGGGGGGFPAVSPWPPGAAPRQPRAGGLVASVPGRQPLTGGGVPFSHLPSALGCRALAQALARVPCSSRRRRAVPAGREGGGGPVCAGGGGPGQWSAVIVLPPTGGGSRPSKALYGGGGGGSGGPAPLGGGVLRHCPRSPRPCPSPGPKGRGRHPCRRLCWGWVCGGGGFRWR